MTDLNAEQLTSHRPSGGRSRPTRSPYTFTEHLERYGHLSPRGQLLKFIQLPNAYQWEAHRDEAECEQAERLS